MKRTGLALITANAAAQPGGIGSGADPNDTRFKEALNSEPLLS